MKKWLLVASIMTILFSICFAEEVWTLIVQKDFNCGGAIPTFTIEFKSREACENAKKEFDSWCRQMTCVAGGSAQVYNK
jgi:hypothetical protein